MLRCHKNRAQKVPKSNKSDISLTKFSYSDWSDLGWVKILCGEFDKFTDIMGLAIVFWLYEPNYQVSVTSQHV